MVTGIGLWTRRIVRSSRMFTGSNSLRHQMLGKRFLYRSALNGFLSVAATNCCLCDIMLLPLENRPYFSVANDKSLPSEKIAISF